MKEIILLGGGGHARSCIDVIESTKEYKIMGIIDPLASSEDFIYEVFKKEESISDLRRTVELGLVAVGQQKSPETRLKLFNELIELDYQLPAIISKNAYKSQDSFLDKGSIMMHMSVLNSGSKIGKNCILNTKSLIEHDSAVGDHCHIATGAIVNGGVQVGDRTFIGSNSVIAPGIHIGDDCFIGAGILVHKDVEEGSIIKFKQ